MDSSFYLMAFIEGLGGGEMVMILLVVLVLFGGEKLPGFARGLGKSIREFKKAAAGVEEEFKRALEEDERKQYKPPTAPLPAPTPTPELMPGTAWHDDPHHGSEAGPAAPLAIEASSPSTLPAPASGPTAPRSTTAPHPTPAPAPSGAEAAKPADPTPPTPPPATPPEHKA